MRTLFQFDVVSAANSTRFAKIYNAKCTVGYYSSSSSGSRRNPRDENQHRLSPKVLYNVSRTAKTVYMREH